MDEDFDLFKRLLDPKPTTLEGGKDHGWKIIIAIIYYLTTASIIIYVLWVALNAYDILVIC